MARMIPSFVDETTPPGERDVFNVIAGGPAEWVVFHALDLAPWNRERRTEVDFIVVIPDTGILCIEVKSHNDIAFDGERWHPPTISRSPFKQAADARFTFYRRMSDLAPRYAEVPVAHCCIFPRARFDVGPNLSVQPWELMDNRAFRALGDSASFCANLKARLSRSIEADRSLQHMTSALTAADLDAMVKACVPVQMRRPDAREEVRRREEQAAAMLREQQRPVLRLCDRNARLVVSGGAGTGKTLIAIELARRAADKGKRVALLCFNHLVGEWMRQRTAQNGIIPPNLIVGRAIRIMAEMTGVAIPASPSPSFWEIDLPEQLEDRLTDPDLKASAAFDYLVLDEAQDFLARPRLWSCLSQFLRGGIGGGSFALLGDFDHQVLGDREPMEKTLADIESVARPVRWHLAENCRNYRIVGETALRLGGVSEDVYSGYLRTGGGLQNYDIYFYDSNEAELEKLKQWLGDMKEFGYKPSDVTLLSFCSDESSAASHLKRAGYKLRPAWQTGEGQSYASVHAFKGMENKIIILTDVMLTGLAFQRDLFYTGMTRATECVRVLCDKRSEAVLCGWLAGGTAT